MRNKESARAVGQGANVSKSEFGVWGSRGQNEEKKTASQTKAQVVGCIFPSIGEKPRLSAGGRRQRSVSGTPQFGQDPSANVNLDTEACGRCGREPPAEKRQATLSLSVAKMPLTQENFSAAAGIAAGVTPGINAESSLPKIRPFECGRRRVRAHYRHRGSWGQERVVHNPAHKRPLEPQWLAFWFHLLRAILPRQECREKPTSH